MSSPTYFLCIETSNFPTWGQTPKFTLKTVTIWSLENVIQIAHNMIKTVQSNQKCHDSWRQEVLGQRKLQLGKVTDKLKKKFRYCKLWKTWISKFWGPSFPTYRPTRIILPEYPRKEKEVQNLFLSNWPFHFQNQNKVWLESHQSDSFMTTIR